MGPTPTSSPPTSIVSPSTTPDKAAQQILKAVERNRRRALIGPDAFVFDLVSRLPAGLYQRFLVTMTKRERAKRSAG